MDENFWWVERYRQSALQATGLSVGPVVQDFFLVLQLDFFHTSLSLINKSTPSPHLGSHVLSPLECIDIADLQCKNTWFTGISLVNGLT